MNFIIGLKRIAVLALGVFVFNFTTQANDFIITDFGARGDGKMDCSVPIQKAIDSASSIGGGRVIIPKGRFASGSIHLKSNVELHVSKHAVLMGVLDHKEYDVRIWTGFIMAYKAKNISISGSGTIDGRGAQIGLRMDSLFYVGQLDSSKYNFIERRPLSRYRPMIILMTNCTSVNISDVHLVNGASWVQNYVNCYKLRINNVFVDSDSYWNNDGIDITDCKNVQVTNCKINSADDGICLKSFVRGEQSFFCDSIFIGNCSVRSSASGVKLGTSSRGGFKNVTIEDIYVYDTYRSAIAIENYENGVLENILVQDIRVENTGNAIFIRFGKKPTSAVVPWSPALKNVTIRNVKASISFKRPDYNYKLRGPALPFFHNTFPSSITGIPDRTIQDVTLENIEITYPGKGNATYARLPTWDLKRVPEAETSYPEFSMFGELPAWGFYIRHVDGLVMNNVKIKIKNPDYRPAVVCDDVKNLTVEKLKVCGDEKDLKIFQKDTENVKIKE